MKKILQKIILISTLVISIFSVLTGYALNVVSDDSTITAEISTSTGSIITGRTYPNFSFGGTSVNYALLYENNNGTIIICGWFEIQGCTAIKNDGDTLSFNSAMEYIDIDTSDSTYFYFRVNDYFGPTDYARIPKYLAGAFEFGSFPRSTYDIMMTPTGTTSYIRGFDGVTGDTVFTPCGYSIVNNKIVCDSVSFTSSIYNELDYNVYAYTKTGTGADYLVPLLSAPVFSGEWYRYSYSYDFLIGEGVDPNISPNWGIFAQYTDSSLLLNNDTIYLFSFSGSTIIGGINSTNTIIQEGLDFNPDTDNDGSISISEFFYMLYYYIIKLPLTYISNVVSGLTQIYREFFNFGNTTEVNTFSFFIPSADASFVSETFSEENFNPGPDDSITKKFYLFAIGLFFFAIGAFILFYYKP